MLRSINPIKPNHMITLYSLTISCKKPEPFPDSGCKHTILLDTQTN